MLLSQTLDVPFSLEEILISLKDRPYLFCLDSSLADPKRGRYSFIGCDPFDAYQAKGVATLDELRGKFSKYQHRYYDDFTPFASGLVGFLSYDYGLHQESITSRTLDDTQLPDCFFAFYDCVITIDHLKGKIHVTSTGLGYPNNISRREYAQKRLDDLVASLKRQELDEALPEISFEDLPLTSNFTKERYMQSVERILELIGEGEIYQVNLSQRFSYMADEKVDPIQMYLSLRKNFPTHFSGFLNAGVYQILSSSPERFLHRHKNEIQTQPMKGTRPRSLERAEDARLREELVANEKEKAELLMVTDLERNDLGRVCVYGSVKVKEMRVIEPYKNVYQAISTVTGTLQEGKDGFDLLAAAFPGGSITGCPKIRAMEVIDELEPTRRSVYTGTFGYMNFNGDMDFNILIRTLLIHQNKISFQVGGGIVADSIAEKEYEETLLKAQAMVQTLKQVLNMPAQLS